MATDKTNLLLEKLDDLLKRQNDFSKEIDNLRAEIYKLQLSETVKTEEKEEIKQENAIPDTKIEIKETITPQPENQQELPYPVFDRPSAFKSGLEKFIGENLFNKIGIVITVIGVAIGAKYAIDHELISPLTRIILGYLVGAGLLGFAIKLKKDYENFSAVLLSGAMAVMYFITYAAYSFYSLMPQAVAFIIMVIITAFTVAAAIRYNRQVIAHIGLVGAYAIPFLLSEQSGKVAVLFSYMAIINAGILVISFKKYWKPLFYSSFAITWLIYFSWYFTKYVTEDHFALALVFLSVFFVLFYLTFLIYRFLKNEKFIIDDIILLLANSFIFFGIGYAVLEKHPEGQHLLGLFTLCNAIIHFIVSVAFYRQKLADKNLFYLVSGLVLIFITIAIPVQLDGDWVTLLWAGESALLFWIGRTKNASFYETLSYALILLAFISIVQDWDTGYNNYDPEYPGTRLIPFLNIHFLTSLLTIGAFGFINFLNHNKKSDSEFIWQKNIYKIFSFSVLLIFIVTLYFALCLEISNYFYQLYKDAFAGFDPGGKFDFYDWIHDVNRYKIISIILYSLFFVSMITLVNFKKLNNELPVFLILGLIIFAMLMFLVPGLYILSELRNSYIQALPDQKNILYLFVRYISFAFVALMLFITYKYVHQDHMSRKTRMVFDFLLHISILWIASSELINWMDLAGSAQDYKLGLSILWGTYSLFLISLGIWKKKKPLRIGAIGLFGITLLKLFFFDISHLETIPKTIVFVSLGMLLLIISFLYNKYKHEISDE